MASQTGPVPLPSDRMADASVPSTRSSAPRVVWRTSTVAIRLGGERARLRLDHRKKTSVTTTKTGIRTATL